MIVFTRYIKLAPEFLAAVETGIKVYIKDNIVFLSEKHVSDYVPPGYTEVAVALSIN